MMKSFIAGNIPSDENMMTKSCQVHTQTSCLTSFNRIGIYALNFIKCLKKMTLLVHSQLQIILQQAKTEL